MCGVLRLPAPPSWSRHIPTSSAPGLPGNRLEGVITLPNDTTKYGPWAGKMIVGEENNTQNLNLNGRVWIIEPNGTTVQADAGLQRYSPSPVFTTP